MRCQKYKVFVISCLLIVLAGGSAAFFGYHYLLQYGAKPVTLPEPVILEYPRGTPFPALVARLESQGLIHNRHIFALWARLFESTERLQAGRYYFDAETSPIEIVAKLRAGDVYRPILARIPFREGITLFEAAKIAAEHSDVSHDDYLTAFQSGALLEAYGVEADSLEGYLFPATYHFYEAPTADALARRAVETFFQRLPSGFQSSLESRGRSLHDGVIIASMIEVETRWDEERPMIAEVIWSRLRLNMQLGIDAAVIYGIEDYDGRILSRHLRDPSNPYNVRIHRGLPPSPIASPSTASLRAVMEPSDLGYLYYVLDPERGTWHTFTRNLRDHNREVRKLVNAQRRQAAR